MKLDFLTIHEEITTKNKTYVKNTKIPGKEMWKIPWFLNKEESQNTAGWLVPRALGQEYRCYLSLNQSLRP